MPFLSATLLLARALALAPVAALVAPGSQPAECLGGGGRGVGNGAEPGDTNVWERVKSPTLARYCEVLARAETRLAGPSPAARDVVAMADEAERLRPGGSAARILRGRALVRLGRPDEAVRALEEARAQDPRAMDDPRALLAWGRALAASGRTDEARDAYDALLPRGALLPEGERGSAPIEASLLALARGPAGLSEALAAAREAVRAAPASGVTAATLVLALGLDRAGRAAEAHALLAPYPAHDLEAARDDASLRDALSLTRSAEEAFALDAVVLAVTFPSRAPSAWLRYLAQAPADRPWRPHAAARAGLREPNVAPAPGTVKTPGGPR